MKEAYYRSLYWSLSQLKNALPSSLESAEREAVLRRIHLLQNQIQALGLARTETLISFKEVFKRQVPINNDK